MPSSRVSITRACVLSYDARATIIDSDSECLNEFITLHRPASAAILRSSARLGKLVKWGTCAEGRERERERERQTDREKERERERTLPRR